MLSSARTAALILLVLAAGAAPVRADERCTGTLCDLYYGGPPPAPAPTPGQAAADAAPKPLMAPSMPTISGGGILGKFFGGGSAPAAGQAASGQAAAAPTQRPLVAVQGGGLVGPRGQADAPCTGTLCDFYYGTTTKWPDEEKAAAAAPPAPAAPAAEDAVAEEAPPPPARRAEVRYAAPRCATSAGDPWHCYR